MVNVPKQILILGVKLYRSVLSPVKTALFGPLGRCRFQPSCSAYALEALQTHGAMKGSWLVIRRLCRCHPWGDFGPDPVPPKRGTSTGKWFSLSPEQRAGVRGKSASNCETSNQKPYTFSHEQPSTPHSAPRIPHLG
jgi:putative membrane protein insertion efficiency factor